MTGATVLVLGGGVGGLSAAHELAERGFDVTLLEARDRFGGKARSMPGPDRGGSRPLPAEHGFRFFPGFYWHLTDTMERIPHGEGTVADNLVPTTDFLQALAGGGGREIDLTAPSSVGEWADRLQSVFAGSHVPTDETAYFVHQLLYLLTSCEERRLEELEETTWWEFIDAESMSPAYRKFLAHGLTQTMVAMRPQVSSARTIGRIYFQLLRSTLDPNVEADRVLNAPTNDAWIDPWVDYLTDLGVDLRPGRRVARVYADGRRVTGVETAPGAGRGGSPDRELRADYYVAALPVEVMNRLRTAELDRTAPELSNLDRIDTAWMNGVQFYLSGEHSAVDGHTIYYDAPWALTGILQSDFWSAFDLSQCSDGEVDGVLSVNVSDWSQPGIVHDKPARECSREEFVAEVWAQVLAHYDEGDRPSTDDLVDAFVDPAIPFEETGARNEEPLLINTVGSLSYRPEARTDADNLVLAADYVRTDTDLASMEAANEAARRAVNGILAEEDARDRCPVRELPEPKVLEGERRTDFVRYRLGLPHPATVGEGVWRTWRSFTS
jgi:uncharacterized protein with NAD-binding domain and iron-sulfur cluster